MGISGRAAIRKHYVSVTFGFMEEVCTFAILHDFRGFHIKKGKMVYLSYHFFMQ